LFAVDFRWVLLWEASVGNRQSGSIAIGIGIPSVLANRDGRFLMLPSNIRAESKGKAGGYGGILRNNEGIADMSRTCPVEGAR
jgi:hypothetical protein